MSMTTQPEATRPTGNPQPESMRELTRVLGDAAARRLVAAFGGTSLQGVTGKQDSHVHRQLETVLTCDEITRLLAWLGGDVLYIPRCDRAARAQRNNRFADEYNALLAEGVPGRQAMARLCPRYGFSVRYGWEIMRRWRERAMGAQE